MIEVQYVKLHPRAIEPCKAYPDDAGWDLFCSEAPEVDSFDGFYQAVCRTGIAVQIPVGWCWKIAPRSGLALKNGVWAHPGIIDSSYRGEVLVILRWPKDRTRKIGWQWHVEENRVSFDVGDKMAQATLEAVPVAAMKCVASLEESSRGTDGFGSTGKK
jgi:dUTP pyrophosphatase